MKRSLLVIALLSALSLPAFSANFERELKSRWLGAWVVTTIDSYSDCRAAYTNNRINGKLVKSRGDHRFMAGELAKVDKIDAKRSRVDLLVTLAEPLLIPYQEGPFTLYREARCKLEFEVEVPRDAVRGKDVEGVEELMDMVLERHASEHEAMQSGSWNEREMEPYPEDYDQTLADLAVWRAERANEAVQQQIDRAYEALDRLTDRLSSDPVYLAGFADGVEEARSRELRGCPELLSFDLDGAWRPARGHEATTESEAARSERGERDGTLLVRGLELLRRLPNCFVPIPE